MYTDSKEQLYAMGIIFMQAGITCFRFSCRISCFYTCCNMLCMAEDCRLTN